MAATALRSKRNPEPLTGAQKCAVLCITLGGKEAAQILQQLAPDEIEQVTREISAMKTVPREVSEAVIAEFRNVSAAAQSVARGGVRYAQQLLEQALGPARAKVVLEKIQERVVDTGLKRLKRAAPEVLAGILRGEHPQTVALILAHLEESQAAALVAAMDPQVAAEVLYRVARMEKISPEMLALVEAGLSSKADVSLSQEMTLSGGPASVARLLNLTGQTLEKQLLETITERNGEIAAQIKALMFVFEDLHLLDGKGMQRLLREIDTKELALALKAASPEVKKHITSNMSERAAGALEEEIEILGPVRVKDVEASHTRIIEIVRQLEESGEILLAGRGGGNDVIK
jgi:flagellar motor switch protein FliG